MNLEDHDPLTMSRQLWQPQPYSDGRTANLVKPAFYTGQGYGCLVLADPVFLSLSFAVDTFWAPGSPYHGLHTSVRKYPSSSIATTSIGYASVVIIEIGRRWSEMPLLIGTLNGSVVQSVVVHEKSTVR